MRSVVRPIPALLLIALFSINAFAITWYPKEFTCPIDNQKNTFMVVGSYGSYIYSYPSKYQWLFFPQTDSPTYYICKKCHLATYMWDFDKIPKDKIADLRKALQGVKVSKAFKEYTELSVTERLEIMEKVYTVLGRDDDWWESFHRVKGYHYAKEDKAAKAADARRKSLALLEKELKKENGESPKKLVLYITGAMKHFLNDDQGALADMEKALATKYEDKKESAEEVKDAEEGLNERLQDYITRIKSEKDKPRLFDAEGHGH